MGNKNVSINVDSVWAPWLAIKNLCRRTSNKQDTEVEATPEFKKKLLIAEHSPIRAISIKWQWTNIPYWVSTHLSRHHIGWEKWVSTSRSDRTGISRSSKSQDAPVNMTVQANAQALINVSRARLCLQASPETVDAMIMVKQATKAAGEVELANVLVPNCVYRGGCPEMNSCGLWEAFVNSNKEVDMLNIAERYAAYNKSY